MRRNAKDKILAILMLHILQWESKGTSSFSYNPKISRKQLWQFAGAQCMAGKILFFNTKCKGFIQIKFAHKTHTWRQGSRLLWESKSYAEAGLFTEESLVCVEAEECSLQTYHATRWQLGMKQTGKIIIQGTFPQSLTATYAKRFSCFFQRKQKYVLGFF